MIESNPAPAETVVHPAKPDRTLQVVLMLMLLALCGVACLLSNGLGVYAQILEDFSQPRPVPWLASFSGSVHRVSNWTSICIGVAAFVPLCLRRLAPGYWLLGLLGAVTATQLVG